MHVESIFSPIRRDFSASEDLSIIEYSKHAWPSPYYSCDSLHVFLTFVVDIKINILGSIPVWFVFV